MHETASYLSKSTIYTQLLNDISTWIQWKLSHIQFPIYFDITFVGLGVRDYLIYRPGVA